MGDARKNILSVYDAQAPKLSAQYQSVSSADILSGLALRLPRQRALDIACGNGRDAKWLAQQGFVVDAVDGAAGMIREAVATNPHQAVTYHVDLMPHLPHIVEKVRQTKQKYDLILISGAWMHLDKSAQAAMLRTICDLVQPGGGIFITLRHGPAPVDRPMYAVSADEVRAMASDFLFHFDHIAGAGEDRLGRRDVWWDSVLLRMPDRHADMLPVYRDGIIHATKNTSYKLGFAHSFIEILRRHPEIIREADDARFAIPLGPILPYWIRLYDGLAAQGLLQIRPSRKLSDPMNATRRFADVAQGLDAQAIVDGAHFTGDQAGIVLRMLNRARTAIVQDGPVRFITRPDSHTPIFTYQPAPPHQKPPGQKPPGQLRIDPCDLGHRFGDLLVAKDFVRAGLDYAPLIDAGIQREWIRFTSQVAGLGGSAEDPGVKTALERVLKTA